jgi:hypothetical protein
MFRRNLRALREPWLPLLRPISDISSLWSATMGSCYEGAEAAAFRQVENGYIYSSPWFVGPSRHYLVNEAQKAAITERVRQLRWVMPVGAIVGLFIGFFVVAMILSMVKPDRMTWDNRWFALMLAAAAPIMATAYMYMIYKLRPLVAGLPPTRERVTWSDRLKVRAARTSWSCLLGVGVPFGVLVLLSVLRFAVTGLWNELVLAVVYLPFVVYCFSIVVYKAGQPTGGVHT